MKRPDLLTAGLTPCLRLFFESLFDEVGDANADTQTPNVPAPLVAMRSLATGRALNSIKPLAPSLMENL
jgi:hypothetical protein